MNFISLDHQIHSIEDYDILCALDRTDYSTVYKALDKKTGLIVAIKVINLVNQAELAQAVQTYRTKPFRNICLVDKCFGQDGKLFIVMEYFAGGSLKDLIHLFKINKQTLEIQYVQVIIRELLLGVQEIHQEGLVHRHIKSANLFLSQEAKVKLSYFSTNKEFADTINKSQSHILSLPYWMAPETIQSSLTDQKTDIWAIGITAFELITSKIPYEDVPPQKVIFKIVQQPPRLNGDYPNEMIDFVHQCLQRDSRLRPTAAQLLTHPFIKNAKKTQLLFELLERAGMLSGEQQQASCETLNYTHNRVVTSLKLDATGTPIREDVESLKEETLKIKRTFRKIEKYKPGLGKIVFKLYLCRYTMKSSRSLKPRSPDEYSYLITHSHQLQQMKTNNEPSLFKYRVLEQKNKKIILEADEDQFNSFANALQIIQRFHDEIKQQLNPNQPSSRKIRINSDSEKSNNVSHPNPNPDIKEDQDFRRRIPHFFLSRFKKWAKMMEQDAAYKYLQNVQESKTSKQQRFELGDLQRCFQVQVNEPKESKLCKNLLKDLFISFLQNEATLQIIHYNKISSIEQKHKYIAEIKNMIQEMYELKPFDSYLSSEKIKGKKTINNNICQSPIQEKLEEQRDDFQIPQIQEKYSNESFKKYNQAPSLVKMNSFQ
ncbi:unnamed protein product [Paramecium sonneborni]|uniref:Protein kinase domain-containing protein n=1 Tax=Paramecium sonneborni TaxID=65129 RepID=A0A8S1R3I3_9CILI|nr:unnamed protein product [Paramecium sonneborni]